MRDCEPVATSARRIRVAFILHVMQVAGAEVLVRETIDRLQNVIEPCVLCLDEVGAIGERLQARGVPVVAFHRRPGIDWRLFGRMAAELRARQIDVVHAHQYTPFFYASIAARRSGMRPRVIFTEHGRHYPDVVSAKRRVLNRLVFDRLADDVTAVCEFSARSLADTDGFSRARIRIIPNGIDVPEYAAIDDRAALRVRLGLSPSRRYVIIVARFHPVKDHATLVRAFRQVASAHDDVELLLAGDGPLRPALEGQIRELGLVERVHLLGVRSDVPDLLRASDVFVLSSVSEAASITLLEAMGSSRPSVVTNVGGNPELVRDGVDGLLVARGDSTEMALAIKRLLSNPALAERMGRAAAARVRERFLLDDTIRAYADLYRGNAGALTGASG
jgi:glycosyltransferase involved in cell wall biosynthesis